MKIDEDYFRALLRQTIEEDPLCCRGVFLLCGLEFTNQVPSLCVTLGRRSVLRVNLDFVNSHCRTEQHVQALLLHEFLHILLGHTLRFKTMTPAWNIALDAVINAIIHRRMGKAFSSMMSDYYVTAIGPVRLLRPMSEEERKSWILLGKKEAKSAAEIEDEHFFKLHHDVESGKLVSDDIIDVVRQFSERELEKLLEDGLLLLGSRVRHPFRMVGANPSNPPPPSGSRFPLAQGRAGASRLQNAGADALRQTRRAAIVVESSAAILRLGIRLQPDKEQRPGLSGCERFHGGQSPMVGCPACGLFPMDPPAFVGVFLRSGTRHHPQWEASDNHHNSDKNGLRSRASRPLASSQSLGDHGWIY